MATKLGRLTTKLIGLAKQFVNWLMARSYRPKVIKDKVTERFGTNFGTIAEKGVRDYQSTERAGDRFKTAPGSKTVTSMRIPSEQARPSLHRYWVEFNFTNPKTEEKERRVHLVDLPAELTKTQAQQQIRESILKDILSDYTRRAGGPDKLNARIGPISVIRIEGL